MAEDKPSRTRPRKKIGAVEMAAIIAYADLHKDEAAASKYHVGVKTIRRYRKAIRDGKAPELASLVSQAKARAVEKHGDLLDQGYEQALRRIQKLLPKATIDQAIKAAEMLGGLKLERDLFGNAGSSPVSSHPAAQKAQAAAGGDAGGATSEAELH